MKTPTSASANQSSTMRPTAKKNFENNGAYKQFLRTPPKNTEIRRVVSPTGSSILANTTPRRKELTAASSRKQVCTDRLCKNCRDDAKYAKEIRDQGDHVAQLAEEIAKMSRKIMEINESMFGKIDRMEKRRLERCKNNTFREGNIH